MAKKTVATYKTDKVVSLVKVIKMVRSPKTNAYTFKEEMVPLESLKDYLSSAKKEMKK